MDTDRQLIWDAEVIVDRRGEVTRNPLVISSEDYCDAALIVERPDDNGVRRILLDRYTTRLELQPEQFNAHVMNTVSRCKENF